MAWWKDGWVSVVLLIWYDVRYLDKSITPIKMSMNFPRKLVVPAPPICYTWLGERICISQPWWRLGRAEVAIFLARTSAAKTSCRAAKLLSKIKKLPSVFILHVRSYIYPPTYPIHLQSNVGLPSASLSSPQEFSLGSLFSPAITSLAPPLALFYLTCI